MIEFVSNGFFYLHKHTCLLTKLTYRKCNSIIEGLSSLIARLRDILRRTSLYEMRDYPVFLSAKPQLLQYHVGTQSIIVGFDNAERALRLY